MARAADTISPVGRIKQPRGRKTYDALIETGFKLLEHNELESISIAELAKAAGYSVGAFYARFHSKDEFFDAMIAHHLEHRTRARDHLVATAPDDTLVDALIEELVTYYWKRRRFWRAALVRSIRDPKFWEPIRQHGREFADMLIERMNQRAKRTLTKAERTNVSFAFQLALGTINNAILNRPGPIFIGQDLFVRNLARAFRLVSNYDSLVGVAGVTPNTPLQ
ncbi:MAG TPA: TetR/AcrR family transcriptional regulator [Gammaproteobacteria bacterium]|jgi:AcrR family transcriptional regulator